MEKKDVGKITIISHVDTQNFDELAVQCNVVNADTVIQIDSQLYALIYFYDDRPLPGERDSILSHSYRTLVRFILKDDFTGDYTV